MWCNAHIKSIKLTSEGGWGWYQRAHVVPPMSLGNPTVHVFFGLTAAGSRATWPATKAVSDQCNKAARLLSWNLLHIFCISLLWSCTTRSWVHQRLDSHMPQEGLRGKFGSTHFQSICAPPNLIQNQTYLTPSGARMPVKSFLVSIRERMPNMFCNEAGHARVCESWARTNSRGPVMEYYLTRSCSA